MTEDSIRADERRRIVAWLRHRGHPDRYRGLAVRIERQEYRDSDGSPEGLSE